MLLLPSLPPKTSTEYTSFRKSQEKTPDTKMSSTSSTSKERHYAHLASQLQILSSNMIIAQNNVAAAAEQARYIRNLGAGQASM